MFSFLVVLVKKKDFQLSDGIVGSFSQVSSFLSHLSLIYERFPSFLIRVRVSTVTLQKNSEIKSYKLFYDREFMYTNTGTLGTDSRSLVEHLKQDRAFDTPSLRRGYIRNAQTYYGLSLCVKLCYLQHIQTVVSLVETGK